MIQLLRAEIAYKKWEYITLTTLPALFVLLFTILFNITDTYDVNFTDMTIFGFGTSLVITSLRLPQVIHNTNIEENRFYFFSTLPISPRTIALTQSLPVFLTIFCASMVGLILIGIIELSYAKLPMLLMFNCIVLTATIGMVNLFLKELLTLLPKYSSFVFWILFIGLLMFHGYREIVKGLDAQLIPWNQLGTTSASFLLVAAGLGAFFGHMVLFTRLRDDFSVRRPYS